MPILVNKAEYTVIGAMSGSSLDGLDIALCRLGSDDSSDVLQASTLAYPPQILEALKKSADDTGEGLMTTNASYSHWLGQAMVAQIDAWNAQPDIIGVHGHTVFHAPGEKGYSLQLGLGQLIVRYLNAPLITDFRNQDIAQAGQGAPLVPAGERALFPQTKAFVNLGGIANLGLHSAHQTLGYDLCGCNQILNALAVQHTPGISYDDNGATAASGSLDGALLAALNDLSFYQLAPPRSLSNQGVSQMYWPIIKASSASIPNKLHTFAVHIAQVIARALPDTGGQLMVTGGGAHNGFLMQRIAEAIRPKGYSLDKVSKALIDYKEALIFAWLALQVGRGRPTTLPQATGAHRAVIGGAIHIP